MRLREALGLGWLGAATIFAQTEGLWPPKNVPLALPVAGRIEAPELNESSGIDQSRKVPGRFWSHNDSAGAPVLFAFDADGKSLADPVRIEGATNVDWEDLAIDGDGWIWIADVGNNKNSRRDLTVYQVKEPGPELPESLKVHRAWKIRYPDQKEFPPGKLNFDAEAVFIADGRIHLFAKHRADLDAKLYRVDPPQQPDGDPQVLLLGTFPNAGVVSAADLDADGTRLAVLTFFGVWILEREPGQSFLEAKRHHFSIPFWSLRLAESICWLDQDTLLIGNEGRQLFRLRVNQVIKPESSE